MYDELKRVAQNRIAAEMGAVTISATGLVHEAYAKMAGHDGWANQAHLKSVAARAMRQVLTDRARARSAAKRGGGARDLTLHDHLAGASEAAPDQVIAIDAALDRLAGRDPGLARLVELRFFGGLEVTEVAEVLGISVRTAARRWARAKAHLRADLS